MNHRTGVANLDGSLPEEPLLSLEECKDQLINFARLKSGIRQQNQQEHQPHILENKQNLESICELFDSLEIKEAHHWSKTKHAQNNLFTQYVFGGKLHLNESDPLACADNYSVIFKPFPNSIPTSNNIINMISLASVYILGFAKFAVDLEHCTFHDIHKNGQKLSIVQYYNFFGTSRISQKVEQHTSDTQFFSDQFADFVVVVFRGHFFKVKVVERNGTQVNLVSLDNVMKSLHWIVTWVQQSCTEQPLTVLTQASRQDIHNMKEYLIGLGGQNAINLDWINQSLFMVTLDDTTEVKQPQVKNGIAMSSQHREAFNYSNHIWYEKAVSLVVTSSGTCGINFEHSFSDSGPAHMMASTVYKHAVKLYQNGEVSTSWNPGSTAKSDNVEAFQWTLDNHIQEQLSNANQQFHIKLQNKQAVDFTIEGVGSSQCKQLGVSPDAFFQIGLAEALFKWHNRIPFSLETIDSRMFKNSRLFVVPTLTAELVEYLSSDNTSNRKDLLKKAIMSHKSLLQHNMDKQGFYLFFSLFLLNELGLRDKPPHSFTQTELYQQLYSFDCVSSNVGDFYGIDEVLSGFPAQHEQGMLVVGYIIKEDNLFVTITSNDHTKSLDILAEYLKTCIQENYQALNQ